MADPADASPLEQAARRFRVWTDLEPRFRDTDAMGHVNNAVYVTYLEVARQEYWARFRSAADYSVVPFVVAHVSVDFRRPVEVGDLVRIFLRTRYVSTSSFAMDYEIFEVKSGQRAATAKTVLVTYDWENGRSMPVPDWVRAGLEAVEGGPLPKSPGEAIPPTC